MDDVRMTYRKKSRVDRSRGALQRLGREVDAWLDHRLAADEVGQYRTQLTTLRSVLERALAGLGSRLDGVCDEDPTGTVYRHCRELDQATLWVRRVWEHYRERFDQRDHPRWGTMLRAADEVVWSCYAEPMRTARRLGAGAPLGSAPLPFVDEVIAPEAAIRGDPPRSLRLPRGVDPAIQDGMDDFLESLPVPTVALPPACADEPWWLAVLGHEVGHTVLTDLGPEAPREFARCLQEVAEAGRADGAGDDDGPWRSWGMEVFADAFFALTMGNAGLVAVRELETTEEEAMRRRRTRYPSPLARLEILRALGGWAGLPELPPSGDDGADPGAEPESREDGTLVRDLAAAREVGATVAEIPLEVEAGPATLVGITAWSAGDFNERVEAWVAGLRGRGHLIPRKDAHGARRMVAAGVLAWHETMQLPSAAERAEAGAALAEALLDALPRCREEGVRATGSAPPPSDALGDRLARLVLHAGEAGS